MDWNYQFTWPVCVAFCVLVLAMGFGHCESGHSEGFYKYKVCIENVKDAKLCAEPVAK